MKNLKKVGQITIFIIIGILFILMVGLIFYIAADFMKEPFKNKLKQMDAQSEFQVIEEFINLCIEKSAADSGFYISEHAGWSLVSPENIDFYGFPVTKVVDYNKSKNMMLSMEEIEQHYSLYTESRILKCIDDFNAIKIMGYTVRYENPNVTTKILENFTQVKTGLASSFSKDGASKNYLLFPTVNVPLRIGMMYDISTFIVNETFRRPDRILINYLESLSKENITYHVPAINDSLIYFLIDKNVDVVLYTKKYKYDSERFNYENETYKFIFGEKFR